MVAPDQHQKGRITYVVGSLDIGGAERHLIQILPGLAMRGWDVDVFTLSKPGTQAPLLIERGISIHAPRATPAGGNVFLRLLRLGVSTLSYSAYIIRRQPDIVHFYLPQAYLQGGICSLIVGPRLRVMSRRSRNFYQRNHPAMALLERRLHSGMKAVLGNSCAVLTDLREEGIPDRKLGLIYNGIDLTPFSEAKSRTEIRRSLGIADEELVFVKVANLIAYKGHKDLLEALARTNFDTAWRLLCVGRDDGILAELKTLAKRHGISSNVIWAGSRIDIPAVLSAADVGVLASHEEGFSNAVLEYMAAGLPTVATDVGGNAEVLIQEESGLIVPPGDPSSLATALARMTDADTRIRMGITAQAVVAQRFSLASCISAYDAFYESLLARTDIPKQLRVNDLDLWGK